MLVDELMVQGAGNMAANTNEGMRPAIPNFMTSTKFLHILARIILPSRVGLPSGKRGYQTQRKPFLIAPDMVICD